MLLAVHIQLSHTKSHVACSQIDLICLNIITEDALVSVRNNPHCFVCVLGISWSFQIL